MDLEKNWSRGTLYQEEGEGRGGSQTPTFYITDDYVADEDDICC